MPALPLHEAGKYVAAAYIVLFVLILVYVAIMATRLSRIERELGELLELTDPTSGRGVPDAARPEQPAAVGRPAVPAGPGAAGYPPEADGSAISRPESTPA